MKEHQSQVYSWSTHFDEMEENLTFPNEQFLSNLKENEVIITYLHKHLQQSLASNIVSSSFSDSKNDSAKPGFTINFANLTHVATNSSPNTLDYIEEEDVIDYDKDLVANSYQSSHAFIVTLEIPTSGFELHTCGIGSNQIHQMDYTRGGLKMDKGFHIPFNM